MIYEWHPVLPSTFIHDSINILKTSAAMSSTTQSTASKQISLPLLLSPHITLHIQTTRLETSTRSFLTTTNPSTIGSLSCLGSFVYAMPNVSILLFSSSDTCSYKNEIASGLNSVFSASASSLPSHYARPYIQFLVALTLRRDWLRPWQERRGYPRMLAAVWSFPVQR